MACWPKDHVLKRRKLVKEGHWSGLTSDGDRAALWSGLEAKRKQDVVRRLARLNYQPIIIRLYIMSRSPTVS